MARETVLGVDLEEFLERHDIRRTEFDKTGLRDSDLDAIARDHESQKLQLTQVANYIANTLQQVAEVHSVKSRLKSADGLVAKIIRKRIEIPDRIIGIENYKTEVTDLVGVRALHLFKDQWKAILGFARSLGKEVEQAVAYHRAGDAEEMLQSFRESGLRTEVRAVGYRSVHHVISCGMGLKTHPVEIQIRTVFEEAWAEIDHIVRYPRKTDNPELAGFLKLFNSFAGTADDMGTYLMTLREWLGSHRESVDKEKKKVERLEQQVAKLKISEGERRNLQAQIESLRKAPSTPSVPMFISTNTSFPQFQDVATVTIPSIPSSVGFSMADGLRTSSVKTCPNGHFFYTPQSGVSIGGYKCPSCNAVVF